jgi:hypothetical protein
MTGSLRRSSTVFDVVLAMVADVEAANIPLGIGGAPQVTSSDLSTSEAREAIAVVPNVEDTSAQWQRMGPAGRDETYRIDIQIRTTTPGALERNCIVRLRDMTAAVEAIWHNNSTRKFVPPDVPGVQLLGGVVGTTFQVLPTNEGWVGQSVVRFEITARI